MKAVIIGIENDFTRGLINIFVEKGYEVLAPDFVEYQDDKNDAFGQYASRQTRLSECHLGVFYVSKRARNEVPSEGGINDYMPFRGKPTLTIIDRDDIKVRSWPSSVMVLSGKVIHRSSVKDWNKEIDHLISELNHNGGKEIRR